MSEQRYRSTAGPALASMDNWNAQQNRRPAMQLSSEERVKLNDIVGELRDWQRHFNPAVEDDNNWYRGECDIDGKDAASIGEVCRDAADLIELLTTRAEPAGDDTDLTTAYMTGYLAGKDDAAVELEPGIDELLDSVSPKANMWTATDPTGGYAASIRFPMVNGEWVTIPATGPTRMAAIQDAVAQAKENGDG